VLTSICTDISLRSDTHHQITSLRRQRSGDSISQYFCKSRYHPHFTFGLICRPKWYSQAN